mmetsp:Transcript_35391/g.54344  ORF Transcript_35391/g.54344 Transcript_35391/m.54344 type:complete len:602 (+) Transcript_35391:59-1864(+)
MMNRSIWFITFCLLMCARGQTIVPNDDNKENDIITPKILRDQAKWLEIHLAESATWQMSTGKLIHFAKSWEWVNEDIGESPTAPWRVRIVGKRREGILDEIHGWRLSPTRLMRLAADMGPDEQTDVEGKMMTADEMRVESKRRDAMIKEAKSWTMGPEDLDGFANFWSLVKKDPRLDKLETPSQILDETTRREDIKKKIESFNGVTPKELREQADKLEKELREKEQAALIKKLREQGDTESEQIVKVIYKKVNTAKTDAKKFLDDKYKLRNQLYALKKQVKKDKYNIVRKLENRTNQRRRKIRKACRGNKKGAFCLSVQNRLNKENREDMQTTSRVVSGIISKPLGGYLDSLMQLHSMGVRKRRDFQRDLKLILQYQADPKMSLFMKAFDDDREQLETQINKMEKAEKEVGADIHTVQEILYGNVCFEFDGATGEITDATHIELFNEEMGVALELAFAEAGLPVEVVKVDVTEQSFLESAASGDRNLRNSTIIPKKLRTGRLKVRVIVGFLCQCNSDDPISDVFGDRRRLSDAHDEVPELMDLLSAEMEGGRMLLSIGLHRDFVALFSEAFSEGVFADITSVAPFPCASFDELDYFLGDSP